MPSHAGDHLRQAVRDYSDACALVFFRYALAHVAASITMSRPYRRFLPRLPLRPASGCHRDGDEAGPEPVKKSTTSPPTEAQKGETIADTLTADEVDAVINAGLSARLFVEEAPRGLHLATLAS
jgi:hypothetical protein